MTDDKRLYDPTVIEIMSRDATLSFNEAVLIADTIDPRRNAQPATVPARPKTRNVAELMKLALL